MNFLSSVRAVAQPLSRAQCAAPSNGGRGCLDQATVIVLMSGLHLVSFRLVRFRFIGVDKPSAARSGCRRVLVAVDPMLKLPSLLFRSTKGLPDTLVRQPNDLQHPFLRPLRIPQRVVVLPTIQQADPCSAARPSPPTRTPPGTFKQPHGPKIESSVELGSPEIRRRRVTLVHGLRLGASSARSGAASVSGVSHP